MKFSQSEQQKIDSQKYKSKYCRTSFLASEDISNPYHIRVKIHPILCKSLFCEYCQRIRYNDLRINLRRFVADREIRMMTLTYLNDETNTPRDIIKNYASDWNKFILYLKRMKYAFNYFKVIEFTQREAVHYHVLIDIKIPKGKIKSAWHKATKNSYICDITPPRKHQDAIDYALKYVTKSFNGNQEMFIAFRIRRYSFSRFTYDFQNNIDIKPPSNFKIDIHRSFNSVEDLKKTYKQWVLSLSLIFTKKPIKLEFL